LLGYSHRTIIRWESGKSRPKKATLQYLEEMIRKKEPVGPKGKRSFRFIDLFAGIGGMRIEFEAAGGGCVFTCEWNPEARKTYGANFPCDHPVAGDIRDVRPQDIPPYDVLVAGFPCQPFEADRIRTKHLLTLQEGVSENQFWEMRESGVRLVVPEDLHHVYPGSVRPLLLSLESFIGNIRILGSFSPYGGESIAAEEEKRF